MPFHRGATFRIPDELRIGNTMHRITLPSDNGSKVAFSDVLLEDCYQIDELPGTIGTVIDIGAHAGMFSVAARVRWSAARIHAYEPNPQMRPYLEQHARSAAFDVFGEAVGAKSGTVSIDRSEDSVQTRVNQSEHGTIPCVALEEAIRRIGGRVDLIKMDCEGAEWELLQDELSWHSVNHLTMEYHLWAGYTLDELIARVIGLSFRIRRVESGGLDFGLLLASK